MNETHRVYFRNKLLTWKEEIIRQTRETLAGLHEDSTSTPISLTAPRPRRIATSSCAPRPPAQADLQDRRCPGPHRGWHLRLCEETGEPIGLRRLDARPIATLSVEAQERHERREKVYRED